MRPQSDPAVYDLLYCVCIGNLWLDRSNQAALCVTVCEQMRSSPMTDVQCEDKAVLHCQGRIQRLDGCLMGEQLRVSSNLPGARKLRLHDIGREGRRLVGLGCG